MFDNINTKYENAKYHLSFITSFWAIKYLKEEIKKGNSTAENYAYLSKAYDHCFLYKKAFLYALKAIKKDKQYIFGYIMAVQSLMDNENFQKAKKYIELANKQGEHYLLDVAIIGYYNYYEDDENAKYYAKKLLNYNYDFPEYLFCIFSIARPLLDYRFKLSDFYNFIKSHRKYKTILSIDEIVLSLYALVSFYFAFLFATKKYKILTKIENLYDEGRFEEVISLSKDTIHKRKDNHIRSMCYFYLSLVEKKNGNKRKSLKYINQSLLYEKNADTYFVKCFLLLAMNNSQEALVALDKAEKLAKNEYDYNYNRAMIYAYEFSDYSKALKYINESLLKNHDAKSYSLKGVILQGLNKYDESKATFEKALKLDENNDQALAYLSKYYFDEKEFNKALVYINRALLIQIDSDRLTMKGNILCALERADEAEICYKEARDYQE